MLLSMTPKRSREGVTGCRTRAEKACTASKLGAGTLSCGFWPGQQVEARSRFVPVQSNVSELWGANTPSRRLTCDALSEPTFPCRICTDYHGPST